jgi:hypothetical protein
MDSRNLLERFDLFLEELGVGFEAIVVGGAALNLLGVISRTTKDCDVLDPKSRPPLQPPRGPSQQRFSRAVKRSRTTGSTTGHGRWRLICPQSGESRSARYLWGRSCGSRHLAARTCSE